MRTLFSVLFCLFLAAPLVNAGPPNPTPSDDAGNTASGSWTLYTKTSLAGKMVVINSAGQVGVVAPSSAEEMLPYVFEVVEAQQDQIEELQAQLAQIQATLRQMGQ
jgi:hypothetical protein